MDNFHEGIQTVRWLLLEGKREGEERRGEVGDGRRERQKKGETEKEMRVVGRNIKKMAGKKRK